MRENADQKTPSKDTFYVVNVFRNKKTFSSKAANKHKKCVVFQSSDKETWQRNALY